MLEKEIMKTIGDHGHFKNWKSGNYYYETTETYSYPKTHANSPKFH